MALEKLVSKYGHKLPEIITRAFAGDPSAIFMLVTVGGIGIIELLSEKLGKE